jgi:rhodanese-related sulfurtransferase
MKKGLFTVIMVVLGISVAIAAPYKNIDSIQGKALIDKGAVFLLDVRTVGEYQQGHLKGAVLIPTGELEKRLMEVPRDKPVLIYCAVGSRSNSAAAFLAEKGYRDVYNMGDGIVGWYRKGFPLAR